MAHTGIVEDLYCLRYHCSREHLRDRRHNVIENRKRGWNDSTTARAKNNSSPKIPPTTKAVPTERLYGQQRSRESRKRHRAVFLQRGVCRETGAKNGRYDGKRYSHEITVAGGNHPPLAKHSSPEMVLNLWPCVCV